MFLYHLCRALVKKGIEIRVITPHAHGYRYYENWDGIEINRFPYFYPLKNQTLCYGSGILPKLKKSMLAKIQLPFFILAEILFCLRMIKKLDVDIIHAQWSLPQGLAGVICKYFIDIPCITTIHGSDTYGLQYPGVKWLNSKVIEHSDVCTANSKATARMAGNISKRRNILVIPMGVNPSFFSTDRKYSDEKTRLESNEKRILCVGRLIDLKGIDYLIRAFPRVLKKYPEAKLIIVGSGPLKDDLLTLSRCLHLGSKVIFIDKVPQKELPRMYLSASLFVLSSIVNEKGETEGLGVVLLEAMACGLPVIGSNVGGIPDIIKDGETGLLFKQKDPDDLAEKMIKLLSDEKLRDKVVENGLNLVKQNFSWEVISDKFLKIYHDVIKRRDLLHSITP